MIHVKDEGVGYGQFQTEEAFWGTMIYFAA
jgi:hypothetical protein